MQTLFAERRLVASFRNRSVVFTMRGLVNEKNVLITRMELEFGTNGSIGLKTVVPLNAVIMAKGNEVYVSQLAVVNEKCSAHLKTVNEYIRLFDETIAWLQAPGRRFNLTTTLGFNPLFIHSGWSDKEAKIEVFGRSTRELNLGFEVGTPDQLSQGLQRLNDIRECLVEYRDKFGAVAISSLVNQN